MDPQLVSKLAKLAHTGADPQFVAQFNTFSTFGEASDFIFNWIRVQKHPAANFPTDFAAVMATAKYLFENQLTVPLNLILGRDRD